MSDSDTEHCVFNAGGSTYLMDSIALNRLAGVIDTCFTMRRSHADDLYLGCCLQHKLGIVGFDTRDQFGSERFHIFPPQICNDYRIPTDIPKAIREDYFFAYGYDPPNFMPQAGYHQCSTESVAFHHLAAGLYKPTHDLW
jgi:hypothetical protein